MLGVRRKSRVIQSHFTTPRPRATNPKCMYTKVAPNRFITGGFMTTGTNGAETTQTLEKVIAPSTEEEEVSEETTKEPEAPETPETPETPEDFETRVSKGVQAGIDKKTNTYREAKESDAALIRDLRQKNTELAKQTRIREDNKKITSILSGDTDDGLSEDDTKKRKASLDEFAERHRDYQEKSVEVEETAQYIAELAEKMPANIVKEFGLNDPNINVRAKNGVDFVNEAVALHKHNVAFQEVVDIVLAKGSEVRQKIDGFAEELTELSDKKGRDLLLDKIKAGQKTTPKKAPASPSGAPAGEDTTTMTPLDRIKSGLKKT